MWQRAFSKNGHSNISSPSYCGALPHHYQEVESISLLLNVSNLYGLLWVGYSERGTVWLSRVGDMASAWLSLSWDTCPGNPAIMLWGRPTSLYRDHLKRNAKRKTEATSQQQDSNEGFQFSSVQSLSRVRLLATPGIAARQASLSNTNSQSSLRLMSIESVMPSNHLILCRPLLLLPPIPPSIRVFSNESTLRMRWPKYWSFSFSISPSKEHPGRILGSVEQWHDILNLLCSNSQPTVSMSIIMIVFFNATTFWSNLLQSCMEELVYLTVYC